MAMRCYPLFVKTPRQTNRRYALQARCIEQEECNMTPKLITFLRLVRCLNVAAITALAVWHGYVFYLNQAIKHVPRSPVIEFQLVPDTAKPTV